MLKTFVFTASAGHGNKLQAIVAETENFFFPKRPRLFVKRTRLFSRPLLIYFWSKEHQKRLKKKIIVRLEHPLPFNRASSSHNSTGESAGRPAENVRKVFNMRPLLCGKHFA